MSQFFSYRELLDLDIPDELFLIDRTIPLGSDVLLYGETGSGKSLLALSAALAVVSGEPFLGTFLTRTGPVLYVQDDMTLTEWKARVVPAATEFPPERLRSDLNILHFSKGEFDITRLTDEQDELFRSAVRDTEPALVVVDVVANAHRLDENEANTPKRYYQAVRNLVGSETAVLHVHHERKPGERVQSKHQYSGSHVWLDPCSVGLRITQWRDRDTGQTRRKLRWTKSRNTKPVSDVELELDLDSLLLREWKEPLVRDIEFLIEEGKTTSTIVSAMTEKHDVSKSTVLRKMRGLND